MALSPVGTAELQRIMGEGVLTMACSANAACGVHSAVPSALVAGFGQVPGVETPGYVRLRAHLNSRVRVPDLADTVEPVTESNCAGAITPGGEQLEVNNQSVTTSSNVEEKVNSFRSAVSDEPA